MTPSILEMGLQKLNCLIEEPIMMKQSNWFQRPVLFSICALFAVAILLESMTAQAATYYVSSSGSDSNSGTSTSAPFRTFARAVKPLRAGDTLYIRGGTWTQQLDLMNTSGTSSAWIKIAGYPGETVTIRYAEPLVGGYGPIKARGTGRVPDRLHPGLLNRERLR